MPKKGPSKDKVEQGSSNDVKKVRDGRKSIRQKLLEIQQDPDYDIPRKLYKRFPLGTYQAFDIAEFIEGCNVVPINNREWKEKSANWIACFADFDLDNKTFIQKQVVTRVRLKGIIMPEKYLMENQVLTPDGFISALIEVNAANWGVHVDKLPKFFEETMFNFVGNKRGGPPQGVTEHEKREILRKFELCKPKIRNQSIAHKSGNMEVEPSPGVAAHEGGITEAEPSPGVAAMKTYLFSTDRGDVYRHNGYMTVALEEELIRWIHSKPGFDYARNDANDIIVNFGREKANLTLIVEVIAPLRDTDHRRFGTIAPCAAGVGQMMDSLISEETIWGQIREWVQAGHPGLRDYDYSRERKNHESPSDYDDYDFTGGGIACPFASCLGLGFEDEPLSGQAKSQNAYASSADRQDPPPPPPIPWGATLSVDPSHATQGMQDEHGGQSPAVGDPVQAAAAAASSGPGSHFASALGSVDAADNFKNSSGTASVLRQRMLQVLDQYNAELLRENSATLDTERERLAAEQDAKLQQAIKTERDRLAADQLALNKAKEKIISDREALDEEKRIFVADQAALEEGEKRLDANKKQLDAAVQDFKKKRQHTIEGFAACFRMNIEQHEDEGYAFLDEDMLCKGRKALACKVNKVQEDLKKRSQNYEQLGREITQLTEDKQKLDRDLTSKKDELKQVQDAMAKVSQDQTLLDQEVLDKQSTLEVEISALDKKMSALHERLESLNFAINEKNDELKRCNDEIAKKASELGELNKTKLAVAAEVEGMRSTVAKVTSESSELETRKRELDEIAKKNEKDLGVNKELFNELTETKKRYKLNEENLNRRLRDVERRESEVEQREQRLSGNASNFLSIAGRTFESIEADVRQRVVGLAAALPAPPVAAAALPTPSVTAARTLAELGASPIASQEVEGDAGLSLGSGTA